MDTFLFTKKSYFLQQERTPSQMGRGYEFIFQLEYY